MGDFGADHPLETGKTSSLAAVAQVELFQDVVYKDDPALLVVI